MRLSAMGDAAMLVPVLYQFRRQYPDVKISALTKPALSPLFSTIGGVDVIHADTLGTHKGIRGLYKLSREIRALEIDAIADMHGVLRTKILCFFLKTSIPAIARIDKERAKRRKLIRKRRKIFLPLSPIHLQYQRVLNKLGFPFSIRKNIYLPKPEEHELIKNISKKNPIVGIAPFAAHKGKIYPLCEMEKVIKRLSKKYTILLFGGKENAATLCAIEKKYAGVFSIAGKYSLAEELRIIAHLDLMISMDSGNGHLAAMYGVAVLSIWGATHPYAGFSAFGERVTHVLPNRENFPMIPASIYGNKLPKGYKALFDTIAPERIYQTAIDILENRKGG